MVAASLLLPARARALRPERRLAELVARVFGEDRGLPQATVFAIAQTPDGYLWAGTDGGLVRFDGVAFTVFNAANTPQLGDQIRMLFVDREGSLWIGTKGGRGLLRHRNGAFESVPTPRPLDEGVNCGFQDRRGVLWFGHWWGVLRVADGRTTDLGEAAGIPPGPVWAIAEDREGVLWVGTHSGLVRSEGARFRPHGVAGAIEPPIRALLAEANGGLWVGTESGLARIDENGVRRYTKADGLPDDHLRALQRDRDGSLWVGTQGGLGRLRAGRVESFPRSAPLAPDAVNTMLEDREGNLWLGTRARGLMALADPRFTTIGAAEGLPTNVATAVFETSDGALWFGTFTGGLARYQDGELRTFTTADGLCTPWVIALAEGADGALWVGGVNGATANVCRAKDGKWKDVVVPGLPRHRTVRVLLRDRHGTMWMATDRLFRFEGDRAVEVPLPEPAAEPLPRVFSLLEDRAGTLWMGRESGLWARKDGRWTQRRDPSGFPSQLVYALHEDAEGSLWIATARGLGRLRDGRIAAYGAPQGLLDGVIFSVLTDGDHHVWLTSPNGILRVDRDELEALDRGRRRTVVPMRFGPTDGLKTQRCEGENNPSSLRSRDGKLWFPTSMGVAVVDPRHVEIDRSPPPVYVEEIIVDSRKIERARWAEVPAGRREMQVKYAALSFAAPERVRFRYRLDPFDSDWVDAGSRRAAYYTNLPPGRYHFRVLAANSDGVWNEAGAAADIRLRPFFYETAAFRATVVAAMLLALFGVHRLRLARLRARHALILAERTRIAREIHDSLAQGFTGITLQLESASKKLTSDPDEARESLDQARLLARSSLAEARRAVFGLRPQALEGGDLVSALVELTGRLSAETPVRLRVGGTVRPLPPPHEEALLRIAQEGTTNALRHASAKHVAVELNYDIEAVEVRVRDDGVGFDGQSDFSGAGHFGLAGMRERVAALGGDLSISSRPAEGTEIIARLPVASAGGGPTGRKTKEGT